MLTLLMTEPAPSRSGPPPIDVERLRAQDPLAFRAFVGRHQAEVFALASRILGRGAHVQDVAQEAFVRAYKSFPTFDPNGPAKVSTWLLTIAVRIAIDERRRRRETVSVEDAGPIASFDTPDKAHDRTELRRAIEQAAKELPDNQCAALVLFEFHGMALREIAEAVGVPENTVKTRLFRAKEKMKASLREFRSRSGA